MSTSSSYLPLGAPVRIQGHVTKTKRLKREGADLVLRSSWERRDAPPISGRGEALDTGIIVGVRTLSSSRTVVTETEGTLLDRTYGHFRAYLVATDMHRRHITCALDQVQPLGDEEAEA